MPLISKFSSPVLLMTIFTVVIMASALWAYIPIARRNGWVPSRYKKDDRKPDANTPIVGGGFVFYISIMFWSLGISTIYGTSFSMAPSLVGLTILAACSFADDLLDMRVGTRLIVQFIAVLFLIAQFIPAHPESLNIWLLMPIYIFFALYFINAYNFMDGIDGITASYSVVVLSSLLWINECEEWFMSGTFIGFALLGALVFGAFNFRRHAMVYSGDVGSISMGYIVLTILTYYAIFHGTLSVLALVAVYVTDTGLTIVRRIVRRENIFRPHHLHIYQLLTRHLHWPHLAVATLYSVLQLAISAGYIALPCADRLWYMFAVYGVLCATYCCAIFLLPGHRE